MDIVLASDPAQPQSHSGYNSVDNAATCLSRLRRLDSTGVRALVIGNVATRVVVEVVVETWFNCVDSIGSNSKWHE